MKKLLILLIVLLHSSAVYQERSAMTSHIDIEGEPTSQIVRLSTLRTNRLMKHDSCQISEEIIELHIETPKKTYVVGEPVTIVAKLTNLSPKPVIVYNTKDFLQLEISHNGSQFWKFADEILPGKKKYRKETIEAGETWTFEKTLLRGVLHQNISEERFIFPAAGMYQVRIKYSADQDFWLKSNEISLHVIMPQGTDVEVWRMLQDKNAATYEEYTYFLKYNRPKHEATARRMEILEKFYRIIETHPGSVYAFILRDALIRHFEDRRRGRIGPVLSEEEKVWYESLRSRN